jgi:hypothetical protein
MAGEVTLVYATVLRNNVGNERSRNVVKLAVRSNPNLRHYINIAGGTNETGVDFIH